MADVAAQRVAELPPDPISARTARRLLRELLVATGCERWRDAAELAVSEIVTNVVLHAHTAMRLCATVESDALLVEVQDASLALPSSRGYGEQATTGRGMDLVASVTSSHGLRRLGAVGKVVWFRIDDHAGDAPGEPWGPDSASEPEDADATVLLEAMPPTLWLAAREHHDALLRELALYRAEHPADAQGRADLARADAARQLLSQAVMQAVDAARARGAVERPLPESHPGNLPAVPPSMDLRLAVEPGQGADFAQLQDALDEAERLSLAGRLLVRPGLPEIVAVRDWACQQVIAQLAGAPSAPWVGADEEAHAARDESWRRSLDWDDAEIRVADHGVVAADESNRIVAISRPLAELLGWLPEDLVGRRVVAIVPHRFREAHVAGFSRHLSTGRAHVIGVPLELPVLRADGSELVCALLIEARRTPAGRTVYLSRITPT